MLCFIREISSRRIVKLLQIRPWKKQKVCIYTKTYSILTEKVFVHFFAIVSCQKTNDVVNSKFAMIKIHFSSFSFCESLGSVFYQYDEKATPLIFSFLDLAKSLNGGFLFLVGTFLLLSLFEKYWCWWSQKGVNGFYSKTKQSIVSMDARQQYSDYYVSKLAI